MSAGGESGAAGRGVPSAQRMETLVGYILLIGVIATVSLLSSGLLWHWLRIPTRPRRKCLPTRRATTAGLSGRQLWKRLPNVATLLPLIR